MPRRDWLYRADTIRRRLAHFARRGRSWLLRHAMRGVAKKLIVGTSLEPLARKVYAAFTRE
jgi:hypothetical protein